MPAPREVCQPGQGREWGRGAGVCTFFGARPRGERGAEQQQQPEPQGPAPLHGAGPGPGTAALTAGPGLGDWASRDGPAGAGGGARAGGGVPASPGSPS